MSEIPALTDLSEISHFSDKRTTADREIPHQESMSRPDWLQHIFQECKLAFHDGGYLATLLAIAVLASFAFYNGWACQQQRLNEVRKAQRDNQEAYEILVAALGGQEPESVENRERTPAEQARVSLLQNAIYSPLMLQYLEETWYSWFPPAPLACLAVGESQSETDLYLYSGSSRLASLSMPRYENPFLTVTGVFDLTLLVIVLLPLTVIVATHDLIAKERDRGTILLLRTCARSLPNLFFCRLCVLLLGIFVTLMLVVTAGLLATGVNLLNPEILSRLSAWLGTSFLYIGFWGALGWFINAFRSSSTSNLVLLALLWMICLVGLTPFVAGLIAAGSPVWTLEDLIQQDEHFQQAQEGSEGDSDSAFFAHQEFQKNLLKQYFQRRSDRLENERFWDWLSPMLFVKNTLVALTGTSSLHYLKFAQQTDDWFTAYQHYFDALTVSGEPVTLKELEQMPLYRNRDLEFSLSWKLWWMRISVLLFIKCVLMFAGWLLQQTRFSDTAYD